MSTVTEATSSSKRKKPSSDEKHRKISHPSPEKRPTDDRKNPFKRVFSEADEIHLLNAFLEIAETTKDSPSPAAAAALLFNRIGKSLSSEVSQIQLIEKLRKLRQKYSKQVLDTSTIKSPHEREVFELSHKIWGEDSAQSQRNSKASVNTPPSGSVKKKEEPKTLTDTENATVAVLADVLDLGKNYSVLMEEVSQLPANAVLREGLSCLDQVELGQLNERWRLQQIAEAEVLLKRAELIQEQTKLILEAVASPN